MKSNILKGIVIGILIPTIFISLLYFMFYFFEKKITIKVISSSILFGVGLNALLTRLLFKKDKDYIGRGVIISSFLIMIYWLYKYIL